jgi:prephenate dehydratase
MNNVPNVDQIDTSSTSNGVKKVAELKSHEYAAIGTKNAAELYGLEIIANGIEDNTQNYTRFLIISKKENMPSEHDKTSMVFVTKHIPGSLHKVIKIFADANINLLKIESRPRKKDLWEYIFIIEFEGNQKDLKNIINEVQENTIFMKILGSYPIFSPKNFK